ncbi:MAG: hypothetical protein Q9218_005403 [Villophora microphyllina]
MSPPTGTAPVQNILSLNDSTSPLVQQLEEACNILEIELQHGVYEPDAARRPPLRQGPREEWTLRWLLKQFETAEGGSQSILLEPKIWLLFGELVPRLPLTNLARLLRDHSFLNVLENALKLLEDAAHQDGTLDQNRQQSPIRSTSRGSSSEAGSSSATISGPGDVPRHTRKRHRDGTYKEQPGPAPVIHLGRLFGHLCGVLRQLQALVQDKSHGYAVEHIKMALRASTEQAASMLGRSLTIANKLLSDAVRATRHERGVTLKECIEASVHIWKCRSIISAVISTNVRHLLLTQFLNGKLMTTTDDSDTAPAVLDGVKDTLEDLLMHHIIIPVHESFENSRKPRAAQDNKLARVDSDDLLSPLLRFVTNDGTEIGQNTRALHPIAHFFGIVVECTPLGTSKDRVSKKGWLQFMFDRITTLASILDNPSPAAINALKKMLETLLEKKMKLEIATLEKILTHVSNILGDVQDQVDWEIISLCLKMDPDVFVVPAVSREAVSEKTVRIPNKLLRALYEKTYIVAQSSKMAFSSIQESILMNILIPLIDSFVHARDLIGFIDHWTTNLEHSRSNLWRHEMPSVNMERQQVGSTAGSDLNLSSNDQHTLWEHEKLLQAVAKHIETRLTIGQTDKILQDSRVIFKTVGSNTDGYRNLNFLASVVVVDCVLSGCTTENTIAQLSETASSLYPILLELVMSDKLPSSHMWRVWGCLATIRNRWKAASSHRPKVSSMEEKAAWRALELLSRLGQSQPVNADDILQCCNFMLSIIDDTASPLRREYSMYLVHSITNATSLYGQYVCAKSRDGEQIKSDHAHILRECVPHTIGQLCSRPAALVSVKIEQRIAFFKQLFKCNIIIARPGSETSSVRTDAVALWRSFLHSDLLAENKVLAKSLQDFRVDAFMGNISYNQENINIDNKTVQTQIFDNIHRIPASTFNSKQRNAIFNVVVGTLMAEPSSPLQIRKDSMKLLISFLDHPHSSMLLLQHPSGEPESTHAEWNQMDEAAPGLFEIAFLMDHYFFPSLSRIDTEAVDLFRHLAQKVLECQLSKSMGEQGSKYLSLYWKKMTDSSRCSSKLVFAMVLTGVSLDFFKRHHAAFPHDLKALVTHVRTSRKSEVYSLLGCNNEVWGNDHHSINISKAAAFSDMFASYHDILSTTSDLRYLKLVKHDLKILIARVIRWRSRNNEENALDDIACDRALRNLQATQQLLNSRDEPPSVNDEHEFGSSSSEDPVDKKLAAAPSAAGIQYVNAIDENIFDEDELRKWQRVVAQAACNDGQHLEEVTRAMSSMIDRICSILQHFPSNQVSVLLLRIVDTVLKRHLRAVSQWHIDQILAVIATSAARFSSSAKSAPKGTAHHYDALCNVFSTIIFFHRKRLGGRYHLILPILQSLLRPLFTPFTTRSTLTTDRVHFTAIHASAYTKLLLQLVDPPLASLRSFSKPRKYWDDHNLNDPTKTAKSIAGQHLHYLISTYCSELLKGRLEPEVHKQLQTGMWKVLDVIPQETLRVMNAGMGKAERAVWRGIYGDWRRNGHGGRRERR